MAKKLNAVPKITLLKKELEIRESKIPAAGMGLFTTISILKGTRIVEYKGRIRTWKDAQYDDGNFYILYVTSKHVIDGSRYKKSLARYINDAKGLTRTKGIINNAEFIRDGLRVFVEATRDIPAGGEIYVGYGKDYWAVIRTNIKLAAKKGKK